MKIIFLDIDGVMTTANSLRRFFDPALNTAAQQMFDSDAVTNLNSLIAATGAAIVVISSWRFRHSIESMRDVFTTNGVRDSIIDFTPSCMVTVGGFRRHNREKEILAWLDEQDTKPRFVILDDEESNYTPELRPFLIKCVPATGFAEAGCLPAALELMNSR